MANKTVWVGCKLPSGLILDVDGPGGQVDLEKRVVLNGTNSAMVGGIVDPNSGGYGLTEVDGEFFENWLQSHRDYAPVKAGLIFQVANEGDAKKEARARAKVDNGLGGAVPDQSGVQAADKK